jgi:DNA-binding transcriptional LysR family regulator
MKCGCAYVDAARSSRCCRGWRPEPLAASLAVAHRRNLSPCVRAFMDWIGGVLAPYLD